MDGQSHDHRHGGTPKTAIIGGGVIGLSIGWRLAQAGCDVDIFERGEAGKGASWAAAGMLAAGVETEPGELGLHALNFASQKAWPAFAAELEKASGHQVDLRSEGTLMVALNRDDAAQLRYTYDFQKAHGIDLDWLTGAQARQREPFLHPNLAGAVFCAGDHQVENRKLVPALRAAFLAAGGKLHEHTAVAAVTTAHGKITGLTIGDRQVAADVVVLAAGAWSGEIAGLPPSARPPIRPIKGQMLALRMNLAEPLLRHVVWTPRVYMVPRHDGRLIVGATTEERGFDTNLTAGGIYSLLEGAWRSLPGVEELPIDELWVGFRPGSRDDAPIIGSGEIDGLIYATGHHRNGILLTPVTADAVSRYIRTGEMDEVARPFAIDRFAATSKKAAREKA